MTGLMLPPLVVAELLLMRLAVGWSMPQDVQNLLQLAALATLVAGFFVVARYRAALDATKDAATAWREERDAAYSKAARLEAENLDLSTKVGILEGRDATAMLAALKSHSETSTTENSQIIQALGAIQKSLEKEAP